MIANATFYKIGFVVPNLPEAAARFNQVFDMDWRDLGDNPPYDYWFADGVRAISLRTLVSATTPRIHLFQEIPGTIWASSTSGAAHHVAYWVDDIGAASVKMLSSGYRIEARDAGDAEWPQHWAYFVDSSGVRIELLDRFGNAEPDAFIADIPRWKPSGVDSRQTAATVSEKIEDRQ